MRHEIAAEALGPLGERAARAVSGCVHCGFCLPACPTYDVLGEEMDSPRGRIVLMKEVLEGALAAEAARPYVERCLGCLSCVSACPSGVAYGDLLTAFRARPETAHADRLVHRLWRRGLLAVLPFPGRVRAALALAGLARPLRPLLGDRLGAALALHPGTLPAAEATPTLSPATGTRRARVALLAGCVQDVLAPAITAAAARVLARNGVEVVAIAGCCCGALSAHAGALGQARLLARRTMQSLAAAGAVDAVVTTAAGCGSGMREYGLWFAGEPDEAAARTASASVRDVAELLGELDGEAPPALPEPARVAYHEACHLAHGQHVRSAPRRLLERIPNLELVEAADGQTCCGSAGLYNLEQPALAGELGRMKVEALAATGADVVAAGNIGCLVQIGTVLRQQGLPMAALHTVEVLDRAYRGRPLRTGSHGPDDRRPALRRTAM